RRIHLARRRRRAGFAGGCVLLSAGGEAHVFRRRNRNRANRLPRRQPCAAVVQWTAAAGVRDPAADADGTLRRSLGAVRLPVTKTGCAARWLCRVLARPSLYPYVLSRGSLWAFAP